MKKGAAFCALALTLGISALAFGAVAGTPSVTVSGVTLGSAAVCATTGSFSVAATVTPHFDQAPAPTSTTSVTKCGNSGGANNNFCGTGSPAVACAQTVTTTTVAVSNQSVSVTGADAFNSTTLSSAGGSYTGSLTAPTSGPDGKQTVTVTATASDTVSTETDTTVNYFPTYVSAGGGSCSGTMISSSTTPGTPIPVNKSGSGSGTATYILDVVGPTLAVNIGPATVMQGADLSVNNRTSSGSANASFSLTDTASGAASYSATTSGTFGSANHTDGVNPNKTNVLAIHFACDAPLGTYDVSGVVTSSNICGDANAYQTSADAGNITVVPAVTFTDQTIVMSQLLTGDYGVDACFNSTANVKGKLNNDPGSLHIGAILNTTNNGTCGANVITGTKLILTLPAGFSFADSGHSPTAHVFIGTGGFDLNNPTNSATWSEVTGMVKQSSAGGVDTIDLTGVGPIPVGTTIYARAHTVYTGPGVAAANTPFAFSSSATTTMGTMFLSAGPTNYTVTANPTAYVCTDGQQPQQ